MNLLSLEEIKKDYWYRGLKTLTIKDLHGDKMILSNGDKILVKDKCIYLNGELICNDDVSESEFMDLYLYLLQKKGYRFI